MVLLVFQQTASAVGFAKLAGECSIYKITDIGFVVEAAKGVGVNVGQMIILVEHIQKDFPVAIDFKLAAAGGD